MPQHFSNVFFYSGNMIRCYLEGERSAGNYLLGCGSTAESQVRSTPSSDGETYISLSIGIKVVPLGVAVIVAMGTVFARR